MNIALPSAQRGRWFHDRERQWVSPPTRWRRQLAAARRRLADWLGRRYVPGRAAGFAVVSAVGGASVNFAMLITARACQGRSPALLGAVGAVAADDDVHRPKTAAGRSASTGDRRGRRAVGLLLGGALTSTCPWRWTLYVNLIFAGWRSPAGRAAAAPAVRG